MIRPLRADEVHLMLEAGNAFYLEGKLPGKFNNSVFLRRMKQLIESGDGVVFASFTEQNEFRGAIAGAICECMFTGAKMFVEVFWFILPRYRGGLSGMKLLQTFDRWAKLNKVDVGAMIHLKQKNDKGGLEESQLSTVYQQMGFFPVEINYVKDYRVTT